MRIKFILLIVLQLFMLSGIIIYRQHWVATGERILLKTQPVDPRDIFRGDYVELSYDITNFDLDAMSVKENFKRNEKVYVILRKNEDNTFSASLVSKVLPHRNSPFIQGRVRHEAAVSLRKITVIEDLSQNVHIISSRRVSGIAKGDRVTFCLGRTDNVINYFKEGSQYKPDCSSGKVVTGIINDIQEIKFRELTVHYGIESYFVEEDKGREIESGQNAKDLKVEVSLKKNGKATITRLLIDGKPLH